MTEMQTFYGNSSTWHEIYQNVNDKINEYATNNNLFIKDVKYIEHGDILIANALFTDISDELFLL